MFYQRNLFFVFYLIHATYELNILNNSCPKVCTCQLEHLTETAIYRFIQNDKYKKNETLRDITSMEYNDVLYEEDNLESVLSGENTIIRSAICILQSETKPITLIEGLSPDIESLTIIQGSNTESESIKLTYLNRFKKLLIFELLGPKALQKSDKKFNLVVEVDTSLPNIKYINLENVFIKNSKEQLQESVKHFDQDPKIFKYTQVNELNSPSLTIIQQGTKEEIIPYEKYKELTNEQTVPLFTGFKSLFFLRIANSNLNNLHWTMFDGLTKLHYLHLEKNSLKLIPPFAFYGTPNLKSLSLAHNNLLDIQITDLAGLLDLENLDLSYNNFSQLSELSLPPFPKLSLANFGNNPISVVFPNTFQVMNTTQSLIIGSNDVHVSLLPNSFSGLNALKHLILTNVNVDQLKRDVFTGLLNVNQLIITGNVTDVQFDCFTEIVNLEKLVLNNLNLMTLSMDAFNGLGKLQLLDLSKNRIETLPPGIFDHLTNVKEIYLNNNKFHQLPRDLFAKISPRLIRLNENPWHCSCEMYQWKPVIMSRIKQRVIKDCKMTNDKGIDCANENHYGYKYVYSSKVVPKCVKPKQYLNWNVFIVMKKLLKCANYRPKIRKSFRKIESGTKIFPTNQLNNITSNAISTPILSKKTDSKRAMKAYMKSKLYQKKMNKLANNKLNNNLSS